MSIFHRQSKHQTVIPAIMKASLFSKLNNHWKRCSIGTKQKEKRWWISKIWA